MYLGVLICISLVISEDYYIFHINDYHLCFFFGQLSVHVCTLPSWNLGHKGDSAFYEMAPETLHKLTFTFQRPFELCPFTWTNKETRETGRVRAHPW